MNIIAWSVGALVAATIVVAEIFVAAMFAIAITNAEGESWLKLSFWVLATIPVATGVIVLRLGLRGRLPGTRRTA
jgi:hypothetical protein